MSRLANRIALLIRRRSTLYTAVAALLCGALFLWYVRRTSDGITPPAQVTDLDSFLLHMPSPEQGYELSVGGVSFIELVGPMPPMSSLPSGPPAYVFDGSEQLVDWTADEGDDPRFVSRWHVANRRALDIDEFSELLGKK